MKVLQAHVGRNMASKIHYETEQQPEILVEIFLQLDILAVKNVASP